MSLTKGSFEIGLAVLEKKGSLKVFKVSYYILVSIRESDALCLIWLILARWLLNWLIFLPSVHFHYVTYYYLPSKQSTKNKLESAFFWDVLSQVWLLKLNEKEDFKRRPCIFAITLLFYLVIGEALCSNKLEKKILLVDEFLCEVWVKL